MKISFSTLGCPGWSWDDILSTARDLGFDGIEVRGVENELYVPKAVPFLEKNAIATIERLKKLRLEIPTITSACYLFDGENSEANLKEGMDYIALADRLGVPYVRVLGDRNPEPGKNVDLGLVAENLRKLDKFAAGKGVMLLVESNGVLANSDTMLELLKTAGCSNTGVLWDVHHPFRYYGEPVMKTWSVLKEYIKFVHIKDSIVKDGKIKYKMMGHGDVPVKEALILLKNGGYIGFVSLEWVKRWCMDLEEPGVVFSHFVNYVKSILDQE